MRLTTNHQSLFLAVLLLCLAACGGGDGGGGAGGPGTPSQAANLTPLANAGAPQAVSSGTTVTLDGSASADGDGSIASYNWTQTGGPVVPLANATTARPGFVAPQVSAVNFLTFSLVVVDDRGASSAASTVVVTVNPPLGNQVLTGLVRFARVPFSAIAPFGLNYANPLMQPSRGVTVRALNATTQAVVAIGATDTDGYYNLSVPADTSLVIEVLARMQRDSTHPLPRWDVRVQDGVLGSSPTYSHVTAPFSSGSGVYNVDIPTGLSVAGVPTGPRASGPFAILDTIYKSIQTVRAVEPEANFPPLYVDWGAQTEGTFFTVGNGQHIGLLSNLAEDTDEFDEHVVAHEFGHYLDYNFSRLDSIGGSHSINDNLDPRVAFSEGFGYFFAGVVLNDPVARDSFVDNGVHRSFGFNMEINPGTASACWCSEASVWSLLWDLYDAAPDINDNVALGFEPIWRVMTGAQRSTPAFATIFPFIEALKIARPSEALAINQLVAAQNINAAGINAFATAETNAPAAGLLPLYTAITPGQTVVLGTTNLFGRYNKLGNRRYLRYVATSSGMVHVIVSTSNPDPAADPDFRVYRAGTLVAIAEQGPPDFLQPEVRSFSVQAGQTYLIDAYDCANGCTTQQGTAGNYNLTVTLQAGVAP